MLLKPAGYEPETMRIQPKSYSQKMRIFALLCLLMAAFCPCAQASEPLPVPALGAPIYSNMADDTTLTAVCEALKIAGLDPDAVDSVQEWIEDYNVTGAGNPTYRPTADFQSMPEGAVNYGASEDYPDFNFQWWKTGRRDYWDALCRSTAFFLMRNKISVEQPLDKAEWPVERMETDQNGFDTNPNLNFTPTEIGAYYALFQPIPDTGVSTAMDVYSEVQKSWSQAGVAIDGGAVSFLTIWHLSEGYIWNMHTALLVELENGAYLLFEKYGPDYPYQATLFASEDEIPNYFDHWERLCYEGDGKEMPQPILLMKNEHMWP